MKRAHLIGFPNTRQPACGRIQDNYLVAMAPRFVTCLKCREIMRERKKAGQHPFEFTDAKRRAKS